MVDKHCVEIMEEKWKIDGVDGLGVYEYIGVLVFNIVCVGSIVNRIS